MVLFGISTLVQETPIGSLENPLPAWSLLLSQKKDFLYHQTALSPNTTDQQGTMEMWDEVFSSVGAQYMDTSGCQVSDLDDSEFDQEDPDLKMDAVLRPGLDNPCSPSTFNDFEIGLMVETPILFDKEQGKENSHPLPKTPVFEGQTHLPVLRKS